MIIKDKHIFKIEVRKKIDKYVKEFPIYFFGNILLNIAIILVMIASLVFGTLAIRFDRGETAYYAIILFIFLLPVLRITLKGFFSNLKILKNIEAGNYKFGIEDHEMDNAVEFIEDLPKEKEEVERLRVSLSFNKLIDVLETTKIIECRKGRFDIGLVFKYQIGELIDNFFEIKKMPIEIRKPTEKELEEARNWPTWIKEISEFPWNYSDKETCFIIKGLVEVEGKNGEKATLNAGDWVVFPKGLECTWKIIEPVEKRYKFG